MEATNVFASLAMKAMAMIVKGFKKFDPSLDPNPQDRHPCTDLNRPNKQLKHIINAVTVRRMLSAKMAIVFVAADLLAMATIVE